MKFKKNIPISYIGIAAGAVNGLIGAGGGMVLVPLLSLNQSMEEQEVFPSSVGIILPICIVSLLLSPIPANSIWVEAWPYLAGSSAGGVLAGVLGKRIPTVWLHRLLGILLLWGGVRYLC